jgi:hypothetical protein
MWNEINTEQELHNFLELYGGFHDCCLKELKYISGAFVNQNLGMIPMNDQRKLCIIFQRQYEKFTVIEMEFSGLLKLSLCPDIKPYTCEILDTSMFFEDGKIYWGASDWFKEQRERYEGTWLCAEKVRWRNVDEYIGSEEIY